MSQAENLKAQIQAEYAKLDLLTDAQRKVRNTVNEQYGVLLSHLDIIAESNGFLGIDDAASRHMNGVSMPESMREKSRKFAYWRDLCLYLFLLYRNRVTATGVVDDFDKVLVSMPAIEL